jgi:hypothetical protein
MATTNNTTNNTTKYSATKAKYAKIRQDQTRLEETKSALVEAIQLGKTIQNFDAKIRLIDIAVEKANLNAGIVREELVAIGEAEWKALEADRRAEAMLRREEQKQKMAVDTPFAKLLQS